MEKKNKKFDFVLVVIFIVGLCLIAFLISKVQMQTQLFNMYTTSVSERLTSYVKDKDEPTWEEFDSKEEFKNEKIIKCSNVSINTETREIVFESCSVNNSLKKRSLTVPYTKEYSEPVNDEELVQTPEEQKEPEEAQPEPEAYNYKLDVYKDNNDYYCTYDNMKYGDCNTLAFSVPTKTNDTKVLSFDRDRLFALYKDGEELYTYNISSKTSKKINLESDFDEYKVYTNINNDAVIGITYLKMEKSHNIASSGYYNVLENKKLYVNSQYISLSSLDFLPISNDYISASVDYQTIGILSTHEEKVLLTTKNGGIFDVYGNDKNYMVCSKYIGDGDFPCEEIYTKDLKLIINKSTYLDKYNDELYFIENNMVKKLDYEGNISVFRTCKNECAFYTDGFIVYYDENQVSIENLKTGKIIKTPNLKDRSQFHGIYNKYVIYNVNDKIMVQDLNSEKIYEIVGIKDGYEIDGWWTGYYTLERLKKNDNTENKIEGLYIVLGYSKQENGQWIQQDPDGNYSIEYCLDNNGNIHKYEIKENRNLGRAKPVLYLYPKKKTNVTVTFEKPELLTTTYPKFKDKWEVTVHPNGDMYDKDGKYYYALYWEEDFHSEVDFSKGFYVTKENALKFLEEKTEKIGLTRREANEFIMYWLPILEKNEKNLVYFELTKEVEKNNKLIITPKPDSLLRMTIHVKKVEKYTKIKEQKLETFKRKGFTAVEWGGVIY